MDRYVVISGCSGGGKSTLLTELRRLGHAVVEEPGRRIVREETASGGKALPWVNPEAFARRAVAMAIDDHAAAAAQPGWIFFDRSLVDAASGLEHVTATPILAALGQRWRYHRRVFLAEPWLELFSSDGERRHSFLAAEDEYQRLARDYPALGYQTILLPRIPVTGRAAFVLDTLGPAPQ